MQSIFISLPLLLSFLLLNFPFLFIQTNAKCHPDDENALLSFKSRITSDPSGILSQWIRGTNCCIWPGISCHNDAKSRVSNLYVGDGTLSGTVSPSLSKLAFLEVFGFRNLHNLSGPLPDDLFSLSKLRYIYIENCNLSGPLSNKIGSLTNLVYLSLAKNRFSGPIPDNFSSFNHLDSLILNHNKFSGRIPSSITKLTALKYLNLGSNFLTGTIPDGIRNLKNLYLFQLERNLLSGTIPDFFAALPNLYHIFLSYNKFHGQLPASISTRASNLATLELGHNSLTGNIPSFLGDFSRLESLDLSSNHFTGVVPSSFSNFSRAMKLDLSHNFLVDPFPALTKLLPVLIDLSYNSFQFGEIPPWISSYWATETIKLAKCGIKMKLEDWKPTYVDTYVHIDLSDNEISGSPVWLLNQTTQLVSFKASANQLKFDLGELKIAETVRDLDLSSNQIYGKVPSNIAAVKRLNVSDNDLLCGSPQPPCNV